MGVASSANILRFNRVGGGPSPLLASPCPGACRSLAIINAASLVLTVYLWTYLWLSGGPGAESAGAAKLAITFGVSPQHEVTLFLNFASLIALIGFLIFWNISAPRDKYSMFTPVLKKNIAQYQWQVVAGESDSSTGARVGGNVEEYRERDSSFAFDDTRTSLGTPSTRHPGAASRGAFVSIGRGAGAQPGSHAVQLQQMAAGGVRHSDAEWSSLLIKMVTLNALQYLLLVWGGSVCHRLVFSHYLTGTSMYYQFAMAADFVDLLLCYIFCSGVIVIYTTYVTFAGVLVGVATQIQAHHQIR